MAHEDRTWFVGDVNNATNRFLCNGNVAGFNPDNDFLIDTKVRINGSLVGKNLIRVPNYSAIALMQRHRREFRMRFQVFVKDSPGSMIVPWVGDQRRSA